MSNLNLEYGLKYTDHLILDDSERYRLAYVYQRRPDIRILSPFQTKDIPFLRLTKEQNDIGKHGVKNNLFMNKWDHILYIHRCKLANLETFQKSNEYAIRKLEYYKQQELDALKNELEFMNKNIGQRFAGGYTPVAIAECKNELDRIQKYEERRKLEIEQKFNGSNESLEMVRNLGIQDDFPLRQYLELNIHLYRSAAIKIRNVPKKWSEHYKTLLKEHNEYEQKITVPSGSGSTLGVPRVGGAAGRHAAAHGGGFNHPGVYAGGVW